MLSICVSVRPRNVSRSCCSRITLLVRTRVCNPSIVGISECGCRPGVKVRVDGLSEGKVAIIYGKKSSKSIMKPSYLISVTLAVAVLVPEIAATVFRETVRTDVLVITPVELLLSKYTLRSCG